MTEPDFIDCIYVVFVPIEAEIMRLEFLCSYFLFHKVLIVDAKHLCCVWILDLIEEKISSLQIIWDCAFFWMFILSMSISLLKYNVPKWPYK